MRFVILLFLFSSYQSFSQKNWVEIPEISDFVPFKYMGHNFYWEDTITKNQVEYFYNGTKSVYYKNLSANTKTRYNYYFRTGNIHDIAEVYQEFKIDTFWQINAITLEDEQVIEKGISDVYNGDFVEYYKQKIRFDDYHWESKKAEKQIAYYENGEVKTKYEQIDTLNKQRFDYDTNGELIRKSNIYQSFRFDTIWQINAFTLEDEQIIKGGYFDTFDSILFSKTPKIKLKGQFENDKRIGEWQLFLENKVAEVSFEENKILKNGLYKEYYFVNDEITALKSEGKYKKIKVDYSTDYGTQGKKYIFIRNGKWTFYKKDGSIRKTYKY